MANYVAQVIDTCCITMQHAERLTVVNPHPDTHASRAVFVDDASDLEPLHFGCHHTVLDDRFGAGHAEGLDKPKMCGCWFAAFGMRSRSN
jgi:hypothetical protein